MAAENAIPFLSKIELYLKKINFYIAIGLTKKKIN